MARAHSANSNCLTPALEANGSSVNSTASTIGIQILDSNGRNDIASALLLYISGIETKDTS